VLICCCCFIRPLSLYLFSTARCFHCLSSKTVTCFFRLPFLLILDRTHTPTHKHTWKQTNKHKHTGAQRYICSAGRKRIMWRRYVDPPTPKTFPFPARTWTPTPGYGILATRYCLRDARNLCPLYLFIQI